MAKPKNIKMRQLITTEAFRLFIKEGYEGTTYKKLADSCNTSRPIIQYYFPKKELLAIGFMKRILELSEEFLKEKNILKNDPYVDVYLVLQIHFAFLLMNSDIKQFTHNFIESRKFTANVAIMNSIWGSQFIITPDKSSENEVFINHLIILGGLFELIYYSLENDSDFDIKPYLLKSLVDYIAKLGESSEEIRSKLLPYMFDEEELEVICTSLLDQIMNS